MISQHTELLVLQVFIHVLGSSAAITHREDDGGAATHNVTAGKDLAACRLHPLVHNDGILAAQL